MLGKQRKLIVGRPQFSRKFAKSVFGKQTLGILFQIHHDMGPRVLALCESLKTSPEQANAAAAQQMSTAAFELYFAVQEFVW